MIIFRFKMNVKSIVGTLSAALIACPFATAANPQYFSPDNPIASTQMKTTIRVGLIVFPPLVKQNVEGRCYGSAVDTIYRTFPPNDYNIELYCATPARIYRDFANTKIDMTLNIKTTVSLADSVYFSDNPIDVLEVMLYTKQNNEVSSISAIHLFNYHGMRQKLVSDGYQIFDQPNGKEAITTFMRGGTDALVSYKGPFEYYLQQVLNRRSFTPEQLTFEAQSLLKVPTYFVVNKSSANAELLIDTINANN